MPVQSQYATPTDLQTLAITPAAANRFGGLACVAALQAASSICDSYLASQFTLPLLVVVPNVYPAAPGWDMALTLATCNIAAYHLYNQFGYNPNAQADDLVKLRYADAIKWLEQIRDEKLFPQYVDSSGKESAPEENGPYVIADPPVGFTNRGLPCGEQSLAGLPPWWPNIV